MPNWTEKQKQTIEERDKNILVAAAAGSGKTAVLVERIKKMVTEENVPINSMLIVTFTNAAASEMREKIRKALKKKAADFPELKNQLDLLPGANISTFHSFALEVIKQFSYEIDLDPDFSTCDESQAAVLIEESLDELLEKYYEESSPDFIEFLDWYGSEKSNEGIKDIIRKIHKTIMSIPDPFASLREKTDELKNPGNFKNTAGYQFMMGLIRDDLNKAFTFSKDAQEILFEMGLDRLANLMQGEVDFYNALNMMAGSEEFNRIGDFIKDKPGIILKANKTEKDIYDEIKDIVSAKRKAAGKITGGIAKKFFIYDIDIRIDDLKKCYPAAKTLYKLVVDFDCIFHEKKAERKVVDFSDIEHYCYEVLKSDEASGFYRQKFRHIFIDEYQDTSLLQEAIIGKISGENNLFMVGDIKQSIYKFRLAEPEIFQHKYENYAKSEEAMSMKIDLNRNFRSKPVILDWINDRFKDTMNGYDEDAYLYHGKEYSGDYSFEPELRLIETSSENIDEELKDMKAAELEALEICQLIMENLGREYETVEEIDGVSVAAKHKINFRDMVILMRSLTTAGIFLDTMKRCGIPCYADDSESYFDTIEINVFMNLLKVMDNKYQDIPFLSVLRSEIFGFTTDELAKVRVLHNEGSYVEAFLSVADRIESSEMEFTDKCRSVMENLEKWKAQSLSMPLSEFVWNLLLDTGYYMAVGAMPNGGQRQANLRTLCDKTRSFSESGQSSLYGFLQYIENVKKNKVKTGQVKLLGENDNVVRIMTIHKSKGLEFPMVICAGMGRKLNYTKASDKVVFHKDIGIGMCIEDTERGIENKSINYDIIMSRFKKEEVEENIRILYVAFTRAKEKLYLTGTVNNFEKYLSDKENGFTSELNYLGILGKIPNSALVDINALRDFELTYSPENESDEEKSAAEEELNKVGKILSYEYPYKNALNMRSKYSVSSINKSAHKPAVLKSETLEDGYVAGDETYLDDKEFCIADRGILINNSSFETNFPIPDFMLEERKIGPAEKGTIYHKVLEKLDFIRVKKGGLSYIEETVQNLVEKGILSQNEACAISLKKIMTFFESELGNRAISADEQGSLRKEQAFNLLLEYNGEEVMVQGIIDCYFEEGDEVVLVDYKTNRIDPEKDFDTEAMRMKNLYRQQLSLYKQAVELATSKQVKQSYLYLLSAEKEIEVLL